MSKCSLVLILMAAAFVPGCGDDDSDKAVEGQRASASAPGTVLKIKNTSTPGNWSFDKRRLTAKAGRVTIEFNNPGDLGHNVRIQTGKKCCFGPGHKDLGGTPVIGGLSEDAGMTATATLNLKPGQYWFLCAIPGHWQAGQRGRLIID